MRPDLTLDECQVALVKAEALLNLNDYSEADQREASLELANVLRTVINTLDCEVEDVG